VPEVVRLKLQDIQKPSNLKLKDFWKETCQT
jgi:hypothetical protein